MHRTPPPPEMIPMDTVPPEMNQALGNPLSENMFNEGVNELFEDIGV